MLCMWRLCPRTPRSDRGTTEFNSSSNRYPPPLETETATDTERGMGGREGGREQEGGGGAAAVEAAGEADQAPGGPVRVGAP
jgi:hypothetical protein